jgi:hypothetical protein
VIATLFTVLLAAALLLARIRRGRTRRGGHVIVPPEVESTPTVSGEQV